MPRDQEAIRPPAIIVTLVLVGISALFTGICASYLYTVISGHINTPLPPVLFFVNIPVLMCAATILKRCKVAFKNRRLRSLQLQLWVCFGLTLFFVAFQILGWVEFFKQVPLTATQSRSFLFVLSALHLAHVLAGIPFLLLFIWRQHGGVTEHRLISKPRSDYLHGLSRYWNFLDILWILLVLVLLLGFSLRWL